MKSCHLDLEGVTPNEINQTEKDKYCMLSLIRGFLKKKYNKTETESKIQRRQVVAEGERG